MKTKILAVAGAAVLSLALSACASTANTESATAFIRALGDAYDHCDRQVTYNLAIGPMNPGSGANVAGTVHCPPKADPVDAPAVTTPGLPVT